MTIHKVCLCLVALAAALASGCETSKPATYQGYVEGEFVYIGGKIGGRLDALRVTRGDVVTAGQTLYVLEHAYETQGLALAEADYRQALETLHDKQKGLRTEEIDQIVADLRRAEAAHALSRLEYTRRIKLFSDATIAKEELDNARTAHLRDKEQVKELEAKLATGKLPSRLDQVKAADAAVEAAQAKVAAVGQPLPQGRGRGPPLFGPHRARQGLEHRINDEQGQQRAAKHHGRGHEQIAPKVTSARQPEGCRHHQRHPDHGRAPAHAALAQAELAESGIQAVKGPAARANQETAGQQAQQAQRAARQQPGPERPVGGAAHG